MSERTIPIIPTASLFQIWEKVRDRLRIQELTCRLRRQDTPTFTQVTPWMTMRRYQNNTTSTINYKQKDHGEMELGDICRTIREQGYPEAMATKLVAFDGDTKYVFMNRRAPPELQANIIKLRRKFLLGRGLSEMPQYLRPRLLRLTSAHPRARQSKKHHIDPTVLFTDKTYNSLSRNFGNLFCKVYERMEMGKVMRRRIVGVEATVWWDT